MSEKKVRLLNNKTSNRMEIVLNVLGIINPIFSLFSVGFGFINDKYLDENINILKEHIEKLYIEVKNLNKLAEDQERNITLNFASILEGVQKTRSKEKIKLYGNVFVNGINDKSIFNDKDDFIEFISILNSLNMNDINLLKRMNDEKNIYNKIYIHKEYLKEDLKTTTFLDNRRENILGFDDYDIHRVNKLISLGLIAEKTENYKFGTEYSKDRDKVKTTIKLTEYFDRFVIRIIEPSPHE